MHELKKMFFWSGKWDLAKVNQIPLYRTIQYNSYSKPIDWFKKEFISVVNVAKTNQLNHLQWYYLLKMISKALHLNPMMIRVSIFSLQQVSIYIEPTNVVDIEHSYIKFQLFWFLSINSLRKNASFSYYFIIILYFDNHQIFPLFWWMNAICKNDGPNLYRTNSQIRL